MKIMPKSLKDSISEELKDKEIDILTIDNFKKKLKAYRENIAELEESSEENIKQLFLDFLKNVYGYKTHVEKDRVDAVIYDKNNYIKTLIEVKSLKNKSEMVNETDLNVKAFHEILLYYYRLRQNNVLSIRTLLITNGKMVYIINSEFFRKIIDINEVKSILKEDKNNNTKDIYHVLKDVLNSIDIEIATTIIDLIDEKEDEQLLYKIFSEYVLFKKDVENDANTLNLDFYNELIYIMGLKENSKAQLVSNGVKNSLLDLTMNIVKNKQSGDPFETALSLVILWINRILFLKLLEAQLKDTRDDENFTILNPDPENIGKSQSLHNLFFNVLNKPRDERDEYNKHSYKYIPYFNSSLFNVSSIEDKFDISSISDTLKVKILSTSKLKKSTDHKELPTWEYLFRFLGCYQFNRAKEGSDKNTIIKSSVLGLVFEKLNGHADGAIFTPASITMSMCRETIQRQVVKEFNKKFNVDFKDFEELKNSQ